MEELVLTPSTVILLVVIVGLAFVAIRRLLHRGMCDCGDHCEGCSSCSDGKTPSECPSCKAAEDMVAHLPKE